MAQIGGVNATFTASVGGLTAGVESAGKAFKALGGDASALRTSLATLQKAGAQSVADIGPAANAAKAAVQQFSEQVANLGRQFQAGSINAAQFAEGMRAITAETQATARAIATATSLTREYATAESNLFERLDQIKEAVKLGGLAEDVANRAREAAYASYLKAAEGAAQEASAVDALASTLGSVSGITIANPLEGVDVSFSAAVESMAAETETFNYALLDQQNAMELAAEEAKAAADALDAFSAVMARGADVARANMNAEERYAEAIRELDDLLAAGAISQETFNRASQAAAARMKDAGTSATQMDSGIAGITNRLNVLIGLDVARIFGSIASTISNAVRSFISMGQAEAGVIDQTSKLAARAGVTYGEMAALSLAAERSGVALESVKDSMTKADIAFARAAAGSEEAASGFEAIGLSVAQLNGMGTADRFQAISAAIAKLPTEAQRAAAAVQIFGRSGADLLPLFEGGAAGIAAAKAEADKFGTALTTAQGTDVKNMISAFETAKTAIQGIVQQVTAYLSPAITGVVKQFNQFIGDMGGANIGQKIGAGILDGAEYLAGIGDWLIANLSSVWQYVASVAGSWNSTISVLQQVGAGIKTAFDAAAVVFLSVFRVAMTPLSNIIEQLAGLASYLPGVAGQVAGQVAAATKGFREGIDSQIGVYGKAFLDNAGTALNGPAQAAGQQLAGPLTTAVRSFRTAADASATKVDEVTKKPISIEQKVEVNMADALKAVDSRSKEGVAEMFRIMRGGGNDVQERQLNALNQIAENTRGMEASPIFAIPAA